jgi:hypothetical protein
MKKRLEDVLMVVVYIIWGILYIIGVWVLVILWGLAGIIEIILFIPMGILWIITGKYYYPRLWEWVNKIMDWYLPF